METHIGSPTTFEPNPRRVRVYFNGQVLAESKRMMLLHEPGGVPTYYFPKQDVDMTCLIPTEDSTDSQQSSGRVSWHVRVGGRSAENAAFTFRSDLPNGAKLEDYVAFEWDKMEAWFEEDEQVFVHPRDPYKRVDVLYSSRKIRVQVDGVILADTARPRLLFETGLPARYYIPVQDTRMELLEPSNTVTQCPYKGEANYYSVKLEDRIYKDLVWCYRFPIPECQKIRDLVSFFNEKVDIFEDGKLLPRPTTRWS